MNDPSATAYFLGERSPLADLDALKRAQEMEAAGTDRDRIWRETGWGRRAGGQWMFETDDSGESVTPAFRRFQQQTDDTLRLMPGPEAVQGSAVYGGRGFPDPPLVGSRYLPERMFGSVYYDPRMNALVPNLPAGVRADWSEELNHEGQHAGQRAMGWLEGVRNADPGNAGADPREPMVPYRSERAKQLGMPPAMLNPDYYYAEHEAEARDSAERRRMNALMRRENPPWRTTRTPFEQRRR